MVCCEWTRNPIYGLRSDSSSFRSIASSAAPSQLGTSYRDSTAQIETHRIRCYCASNLCIALWPKFATGRCVSTSKQHYITNVTTKRSTSSPTTLPWLHQCVVRYVCLGWAASVVIWCRACSEHRDATVERFWGTATSYCGQIHAEAEVFTLSGGSLFRCNE